MSDEREVKGQNWSVKTTNDITETIEELLKKTGLSNKDLFATMVSQFKTNLMAGSDAEQTEDMQQLKYHLAHAESIFMAMIQKVQDLKSSFAERIEQENLVHRNVLHQVELAREQAETERDKSREELAQIKAQNEEFAARNTEIEANHKSDRITIELLSKQKEELEARVGAAVNLEVEVKELHAQLAESQRQNDTLQADARQNAQKLEFAQSGRDVAEKERERAIAEMRWTHEKDIAAIQEIADLKVQAAKAEADKRVLEATAKVREECAAKIETLQEKIQALMERTNK